MFVYHKNILHAVKVVMNSRHNFYVPKPDMKNISPGPTIAIENKIKVEARIRQLEGGQKAGMASGAKSTGMDIFVYMDMYMYM
jgi:hypothetical protein